MREGLQALDCKGTASLGACRPSGRRPLGVEATYPMSASLQRHDAWYILLRFGSLCRLHAVQACLIGFCSASSAWQSKEHQLLMLREENLSDQVLEL